jgi:hypothetical protein
MAGDPAGRSRLSGTLASVFHYCKYFFDQRASRRSKLLEKLKYAVSFLSAADWAGRAFENYMNAGFAAMQDRTKGNAEHVATIEEQQSKELEEAVSALKDAHVAACALH